jgi:queuosine precursor transporter
MDTSLRARIGLAAFACFLASIPLANWMILHVGTVCVPQGPCLVPVAPSLLVPSGLLAPSGVLTVGAALVLRDVVQRCLGLTWGLAAIAAGTVLSSLVAPASLVLASGSAFALSEIADFAVYTPLQRRQLTLAVVASSIVGLVVDSVAFLALAFGSLDFLAGQVVGKLWAVVIAIPLVRLLRRVAPTPA